MIEHKIRKYLQKLQQNGGDGGYDRKLSKWLHRGGYVDDAQGYDQHLADMFQNKKPLANGDKYLIILYGPPASGKTMARQIIMDRLRLNKDDQNCFVDVSIDDIIGAEDSMKHNRDAFKLAHQDISGELGITRVCEKKDYIADLTEPDKKAEQIFAPFTEHYHRLRGTAGSIIFERALNKACDESISLFVEITGSRVDWYIRDVIPAFKKNNYKVWVVYPYVDNPSHLYLRNLCRSVKDIRYPTIQDIQSIMTDASVNIKRFENKVNMFKYDATIPYDGNPDAVRIIEWNVPH